MIKIVSKILFSLRLMFFLLFVLNASSTYANESIVKSIEVVGEKRLSVSYIKKFIPDLKDGVFDDQVLNTLTKNLYLTGFFSSVKLQINNNILLITIKELPIINNISFSGNDILTADQLKQIVSILPRQIFNKETLNEAIDRIRGEYQKIGRYLAEVNVKQINLLDGRVNIVFEINEGVLLVVKNINFVGNKIFSDSDLKNQISTKEDAWYKIFGSNKFIPERLEYDKEQLVSFYNERGYVDFKVEIARGDLLPDLSGFNLNFIVNEGPRYLVNDINIETKLTDVSTTLLLEKLSLKKEDYYDSRALDESKKYLNKHFINIGYSFVKVISSLEKINGLLNFNFIIKEGDEKYVNRIIVSGNTRTNDNVIRREISFFEGDTFNKSDLIASINSLKRLGYFEYVNYRIENLKENNLLDVFIDVKEANTGSVSFGIGYSSLNNSTIKFGLNERNFLGEGNKVRLEASLSEKQNNYNVGITNPYFLDRPLSISGDVYNEEKENTAGDIKSSSTGFGLGFGIKKNTLLQKLNYNLYISESTTSSTSTAASSTGEENVEIITSALSYKISKDTRDAFFNPTSGHFVSFVNTLSGFGGDSSFLKSEFRSKSFYPINYGDFTLGFKTGAGSIASIDDKITSSNRFYLGGKKIRGFDSTGVGPRDTGNKQVVGGNNFYNLSLELRSDEWMPSDTGLEWFVFSDAGSIWGTDFEAGVQGYDDSGPRITYGFGLSMITPVGPLQMLWGFPVQSESYDLEEKFQFSLGSSF